MAQAHTKMTALDAVSQTCLKPVDKFLAQQPSAAIWTEMCFLAPELHFVSMQWNVVLWCEQLTVHCSH